MVKDIKMVKSIIEYDDGTRDDYESIKVLTTKQVSNLIYKKGLKEYNTSQKLNKRLNELGVIYKHRTDVWDITKKYEYIIGENIIFENGQIKWYSNKLSWLIQLLEQHEDKIYTQLTLY